MNNSKQLDVKITRERYHKSRLDENNTYIVDTSKMYEAYMFYAEKRYDNVNSKSELIEAILLDLKELQEDLQECLEQTKEKESKMPKDDIHELEV